MVLFTSPYLHDIEINLPAQQTGLPTRDAIDDTYIAQAIAKVLFKAYYDTNTIRLKTLYYTANVNENANARCVYQSWSNVKRRRRT